MSRTRLELLQWFGLLAAPAAWALHLVLGLYFAEAHCEASHWRVGWLSAQVALTFVAVFVALVAEVAALLVYRELRDVAGDAPGPSGRQRLFAVGGLVGNVLFLVAILLTGFAVVATRGCAQA
jgi:hypothetical protein